MGAYNCAGSHAETPRRGRPAAIRLRLVSSGLRRVIVRACARCVCGALLTIAGPPTSHRIGETVDRRGTADSTLCLPAWEEDLAKVGFGSQVECLPQCGRKTTYPSVLAVAWCVRELIRGCCRCRLLACRIWSAEHNPSAFTRQRNAQGFASPYFVRQIFWWSSISECGDATQKKQAAHPKRERHIVAATSKLPSFFGSRKLVAEELRNY